ncbi:hypothetical protein NQD34_003192 [Periophthalmus magnuspinnatus]|nr:hypothetical protein NQD34_003192 [Periophthalmus magnuspinnatus]
MGKVHLLNNVKENTTEYSLVRVKSTWTCKEKHSHIGSTACVSPAKIYETLTEKGTSWTVVTPIIFSYKVTETHGLLDPCNATLLTGHAHEPQTSADTLRIPSKPIKRFVVVDQEVYRIYGSQITKYFEVNNVTCKILALPTTEENKSMEMALKILEELNSFSIDRRAEPVIAIGGGVCLDIVGLAASLYRRRTPYIRVPTTLLSYIDASVGAKTGVNFANCKNKLGSYIPPVATYLDLSFIKTIPRRHISNGLAEMLKMALMKHKELFELLEKHGQHLLDSKFQSDSSVFSVSSQSASRSTRLAIVTMLEELAPNLWEDDLNRLVDFGHVISPALEMRVLPSLLHGEAVNIDMAYMVYVSRESGQLTEDEKNRIISCMVGLELPVWHQACTMELIQSSLQDRLKHSGGLVRMPLPVGLGQAEIFNNTSYEVLTSAFEKWCNERSC